MEAAAAASFASEEIEWKEKADLCGEISCYEKKTMKNAMRGIFAHGDAMALKAGNDPEPLENGADENCCQNDGGDIFNKYLKHSLPAETTIELHLGNNGLRLDDIAHENAG